MFSVPNTWRKISVIDLGYNSLKMVSYEVRYDGTYRAYNQMSEITRIGEGMKEHGVLGEQSIERTLNALKIFSEVNRIEKIHTVVAVATSAVRDARNGDDFISRAKSSAGISFRVLSPEEEALFSYIGCAGATDFPDTLFFDLGGGSLEMVYAEDSKVQKVVSLPLGALRMSDIYGVRDKSYSKSDYEKLKAEIRAVIPGRKELGLGSNAILVGVGGTLRAIARIDQGNRSYPLYKMHNYNMSRASVSEIHKMLISSDRNRIQKLGSLSKGRAGSIATGSLVISMLMEILGFRDVTVSSHSLRDGVITEYLRDPKSYTRNGYSVEMANQTLSTMRLSSSRQQMIQELHRFGILDGRERRILEVTMGNFMDIYFSTRPEAMFYSVMSQDCILTHQEQLAAAVSLVRAKSQRTSRWFQDRFSQLLEGFSRKSINRMGAVIHLTELVYITGSTATLEKNNSTLTVRVKAGARGSFPDLMIGQVFRQLQELTEMDIRTVVA